MNSRKLTARTNSLQPVHWFPFLLCALCVLCGLCVNSFFSCAYVAHFIRKYYKFHSKLVLYRNIIGQSNFFMLPCLVDFRSQLRHASQLGGLFPFSPYIIYLLPCFLSPSTRDEDPVKATPSHSVTTPYDLKSFSCNTYGPPRKCCKQKTYGLAKSFSCNTYKKKG